MTRLLMHSVAPALALFLALPAAAQDFDLPPDLPGAGDLSGVPQTEAGPAPNASETAEAAPGEAELPPDVAGAPVVPEGDIDPEAEAVMLADVEEDRWRPRHGTLEVEARAFHNTDLAGDTQNAFRLSAHYFGQREITDRTSLLFNLRARADTVSGRAFRFEDDFNFDVQELALSFALGPQTTVQFGRINIRNGVATGYNPTDWFKDDSLVVTGSAAPADRRNERLGVLALTGTTTIGQTLVTAGYRPEIDADMGTVWTDADNYGLQLHRTNPTEAWFLKLTPPTGNNLSLTANAVMIDGDPGLGFELSGGVGDNLVLYSEVMAQQRLSIADEALGTSLGSLGFRNGVGAGQGKDWHWSAALGLNWALPTQIVGQRDISLTLEYHLNTAGLSGSEIDALAGAAGPDGAAAGAIYGVAARRQEPLAQQQIFARAAWNDIWGDSDISLLGFYVQHDGSGLAQISYDVPVGRNGSFNLRGITTFGDDSSIYGANPNKSSVQMGLTYTF
ncbi:hypothetical protein ACN2XU_14150 [Primorskyibacter sp. 2E107]|uniref:hypothetical protein n=1 Tax=Primorskyibacter sp. 2E107 TaxID=3403458 RepID=UPI003AF62779